MSGWTPVHFTYMVVWSLDSEYPWALCRIRRPRTRTSSHCSADKILLNKNMIYPSICSQQKIHEDSLKEEFSEVYYAHTRSSSRAVLPLCIFNVSMIVNQTISMTVFLQWDYRLHIIYKTLSVFLLQCLSTSSCIFPWCKVLFKCFANIVHQNEVNGVLNFF